jgi:acetylornithine deacetylase/succinyl-diaminopimelate desuccinylase-like protein
LATASCEEGVTAEVTIPVIRRVAYTGLTMDIPADNPPYVLESEDPAVVAAARIVDDELGARPVDVWKFATDGGHFAARGAVPIGFGPGDESLAHTVEERVAVSALEEALRVNARFAVELAIGQLG